VDSFSPPSFLHKSPDPGNIINAVNRSAYLLPNLYSIL